MPLNHICHVRDLFECDCGTECKAQPSARLMDLNRKLEAATTSYGRAWIAFIGAVFVSFAMLLALVAGAGQQHQINLIAQESHHG